MGDSLKLDEPAAQLYRELKSSQQAALKQRRPIIHHLNDDSSWLLQIPRPETAIRRGSRIYFNIVVDPWFTGGQSDIASWFSQQYHATQSAVQSFTELEDLIRGVERLASAEQWPRNVKAEVKDASKASSLIDVIAVSHEFTDHCHHDTLLEVNPDVPVFAFPEAAALIKSWNHFRTVMAVDSVGTDEPFDWRSSSISPFLPEWLGICRIQQTEDRFNYHSALMISFNNRHGHSQAKVASKDAHSRRYLRHKTVEPDEDDEAAEAFIYTPHGLHFTDFEVVPNAEPSISTLAFLHGLHNVRVGTASGGVALQLNLGSHNGLKSARVLKARYWIGTHDEVKKGGGLVSWFLQRDSLTLQDALDLEKQTRRQRGQENEADSDLEDLLDSFDDSSFLDLKNGESRILL